MSKQVLTIAHRGASGTCPENTFASFREAVRLKVDMIETDIRLTKDLQPVLFHDTTLHRTTKGKGLLKKQTLEELRTLEAGSWFRPSFSNEKIPTLEKLLQWASTRIGLFLEMKAKGEPKEKLVKAVLHALKRHTSQKQRIILGSGNPAILKLLKGKTNRPLAYNFSKNPRKALLFAKEMGLAAIGPEKKICTPELVQEAHAMGLLVLVWTVDSRKAMKHYVSIKVDGIMSNFPDQLTKI